MAKFELISASQISRSPHPSPAVPDPETASYESEIRYKLISKPAGCAECPYRRIGQGFCPDWRSATQEPRIAVLLESPGQEEIQQGQPLVGRAGRLWVHTLIEKAGYTRDDVLICNTLRCHPPNDKYPTGKMRKDAERLCRQYDDKLRGFNPDLFVITAHPAMLLRSSAMYRLVARDVQKTFALAAQGFRPVLLMGDKAMGTFAPWASGGVKRWRGHVWEATLESTMGVLSL